MNYLVIDLEMCRVPWDFRNKNYKYADETIQIGAVLLDDEFKKIGTLSQYVCPEHGVIDSFIQNLTGISNKDVKKAPKLQEALIHLINWIGEREYKIYAWSSTDRNQILHEVKAKNIENARIDVFMEENRWIDYQAVFSERYEFDRCLSLQEALIRADIEPEGRFHDGLDDAINTGYLIEKIEMNPDFKLVNYETPENDKEECSYSLGELLAGLNLQFV